MAFGEISQFVNANDRITNIDTFLNNKTSALVSPKTSPGISGWVFDIPEKETVKLEADITDHYAEDNSFVNDHRVLKPIEISLSGLIGELVVKEDFFQLILETLTSTLSTVDVYLGKYTNGTTQILQNKLSESITSISRSTQLADRIKNVVQGFDGEGQYQNLQQRAYSNLEALFKSETVLTVQTPWKYFDSMMIRSLEFTQEEDSEYISNISITLKEVRFAQIGVIDYSDNLEAIRNELQSKETNDSGKIKGTRNSFLFDATSAVSGGF